MWWSPEVGGSIIFHVWVGVTVEKEFTGIFLVGKGWRVLLGDDNVIDGG